HVLETLLDVPWSWTPVLQGRTVEDYLRHAVELAGILYDLAAVYRKRGLTFRVGLGSICRRGQASEIHRIVASVATVLPGIPLHLLGRLGPVICHLECMRCPTLHLRQRFLRCHSPQEQGGILGDEALPFSAACRQRRFEAAPLPGVPSFSRHLPLPGDRGSNLLDQARMPLIEGVAAVSGLQAD